MRADYEYPDHFRPYEALDALMLEWAERVGRFDSTVASAVADGISKLVAPGPRWMASAEARGLIQRHDEGMAGPRWFTVTDAGRARLAEASKRDLQR